MYLGSILSHFKALKLQKFCSFWGLHPSDFYILCNNIHAVPPLYVRSRIASACACMQKKKDLKFQTFPTPVKFMRQFSGHLTMTGKQI